MLRIIILTLVISLISTPSFAAALDNAKVAFKSGNWRVLRSTDAMTDKIDCVGIYKDNYEIQLAENSLYIAIRGGIQGITLRFGDNAAKPMRLAEDVEKQTSTVAITGSEFSHLLENNRLRMSVLTLVNGIDDKDLDITGIKSAVENIKNNCPLQADAGKIQKTDLPPLCSDQLISRMKDKGLKAEQVNDICGK